LFNPIAVTAAMEREIAFLRTALKPPDHTKNSFIAGTINSKSILVLRTGVGPRKTMQRMPELTKQHSPQCVISIGCAGALRPDIKTGDVVISEKLIDDTAAGKVYYATPVLVEIAKSCCREMNIPCHLGSTVSTANVAATPGGKRELAEKYDALSVDMESAQVAAWAENLGISMVSIRTISDSATDRIPPEISRVVDQDGKILLLRAVAIFAARPDLLLTLVRLKGQFHRSFSQLEKVVILLLKNV
jgi:adenosylhomocysteine nucleosidase